MILHVEDIHMTVNKVAPELAEKKLKNNEKQQPITDNKSVNKRPQA